MKIKCLCLLITAGIIGCTVANGDGTGITVKLGTLGPGVDLTIGVISTVNLRLNVNGFSYKPELGNNDDSEEGEELVTKLSWFTAGGLIDWHPGNSIFRFSVGMFLNNNEVNISADIDKPVEIGDHEYRVSNVKGKISFDNVVPYFGIGLGNASSSGPWHVALDLGVLLQGSPRVDLSATAADPAIQPLLNIDVEKQRKDFEDDLKPFDIYPVLSLGISYTF